MLEVIKKRRSHREFQDKEVEREKVEEILKAAMVSPSARHMRLWEFIVVKDKKVLAKLAQTKTHSYFVDRAPLCLTVCSRKDEEDKYWLEDGSIAAAHIYLEAENQGLGTCFVQVYGSKREDGSEAEEYVKKILQVPEEVKVLCLMPLGYPAKKLPEHGKDEFEEDKIHWEKY